MSGRRSLTPLVPTSRVWPRWMRAGSAALAGLVLLVAVVAATAPSPPTTVAAPELPATVPVATDDAPAEGAEAVEALVLPLVTYELFLARDPFEPVVPEPEPAPTEPLDPTAPADPSDPAAPVDPSVPGGPSDPTAPDTGTASNGGCTGTTEVVCDGRVLTVIEVFEENGEFVAVIAVDTMRYRVVVGDLVADRFQVLSISADEVRLLYGDRVVRVLVGDNALK